MPNILYKGSMKNLLICWIGFADLKASAGIEEIGLGPIAQAALNQEFDEIILISDRPEKESQDYLRWLETQTSSTLSLQLTKLSSPINFGEIYTAAVHVIEETRKHYGPDARLTYHLSPGTPAMAAVWIIISKTRFPATLIESSFKGGVKVASVPFDISAEFIPDLLRKPDERLQQLTAGLPPEAPEFSKIFHRSQTMKRLIAKARHIAPRSIPVLIEGESGTGKELLARAIHEASPRSKKPFLALNCGAIPSELVESELFGHVKGAFTGASAEKKGYFEAADSGTLFLDEIGELSLAAQVKLLRAIQEREIVRVGSTVSIKFDVRIIAATNRNLIDDVAAGDFRSDLFYRIAVAILRLPPLRDRPGDITLLVDHFIGHINAQSIDEPGYKAKKISSNARNLMLHHSWPGNIRELENTLRRAAIWSSGQSITVEDIREAMLPVTGTGNDTLINRSLSEGVNLPDLMTKLAKHYLTRALDEAHGNKTKAAELVGLPSYQTFSNWLKKYDLN